MLQPLYAESNQTVEFVVNMNGILKEIVFTDSLYKIHLDTKGHVIQFSHRTQGQIKYYYKYTDLEKRQLYGPGIRYDERYRIGQIGTFEILYDQLLEEVIEKFGPYDLHYIRTGERYGELEYINDIVIRNKHRSPILDLIGDAIFYYRITDDKIEEIKGEIDEDPTYRIRLIIGIDDTFEE